MRLLRGVALWIAPVGLMLALGQPGWGQLSGSGGGHSGAAQSGPTALPPIVPEIPASPQMEHDQAKARNDERQKQLVNDTQKLLALANELKSDVDKSSKDTLSLDVIRKADEIEKLAHSVKEKMKGS